MGLVHLGRAYSTHEQSHQTVIFIKHCASIPGLLQRRKVNLADIFLSKFGSELSGVAGETLPLTTREGITSLGYINN